MALLPKPLEQFLSSYPHPCFALQAAPLHGALTTRQTTGYETASREPTRATTASRTSKSTESSQYKGSARSNHSSGRQRLHNADEILSTAFGNEAPILASGPSPPSHASLLEGGSQQSHHPSRTAEGAVAAMYEQRAAREVQGIRERAQEAESDEGRKLAREGAEQAARENGGDKWSGTTRNMEAGTGGDRGREGMGAGLAELLTPVWSNARFEDLVKRQDPAEGERESEEITLMSLMSRQDVQKVLALLVQVTSPSPASSSAARSDNTITLVLTFPRHSANYRSSRRKHRSSVPARSNSTNPKPDLKANAYNPTNCGSVSSGSQSGSSVSSAGVEVENDYNFQLVATWMEQEDLVVITSIATNIFPSVETLRGATRHPNKAHSRSSIPIPAPLPPARPILSHSQPSSAELPPPPPPTRPTASPSPTRALEPIDEAAASSASSDSGSGAGKSFPSRPTLPHRESATSGASGSSSVTVTAQSTTSNSTARTPTASRPGTRASSSQNVLNSEEDSDPPRAYFSSAAALGNSSPVPVSPLALPTDKIPEPLPRYTGQPVFDSTVDTETARAAALMLLGNSGTRLSDPAKEYLLEKRKKRKAKREKERREREAVASRARAGRSLEGVTESGNGGRAGEERELTHEEEKVQGRREREARKWREEMEAREDAEDADEEAEEERQLYMQAEEESERSELDERMDRELDRLRGRSRDGSGDEGGLEGEMPRASSSRHDTTDSGQGLPGSRSTVLTPSTPALSSDEDPSPLSVANLRLRTFGGDNSAACINAFLEIINRTPVGRLIATHTWEKTSLGPISSWSAELRSMVMLCLASPFRSSLWWGKDSVLIYNDEYARLLAKKHPGIMGLSGAVGWAELWDTLGPLAARVMQGETVSYFDHHLPMLRDGFLEETYHIWSYIPFRDREGQVVGYENTSLETTARVVAERRLATMRDLAQITQLCRTTPDYYQKAIQVLAQNSVDIPFVILYSCDTVNPQQGKRTAGSSDQGGSKSRNDTNAGTATIKLTLQGTVGVPDGHPSAPAEFITRIDATSPTHQESMVDGTSDTSSTTSNTGTNTNSATNSSQTGTTDSLTSWPFQEACSSRKPVFINELAGRTKGFQQRGWPSDLKHAVVIPLIIEGDTSSIPKACVVVGLNPRRPWDELFATFISMLSRSLSTGLLNATMAETETQRTEELLQLDKSKNMFLAHANHELRTPLTLILGPLEDVLSSKTLRLEDREKLRIVQRHGNRLLNLVNSLLDFSRLEGGKMEITFRPVQLGAMTADLASLFRSAVERGGIELIVDCPPDPNDGAPVYLAAELYEKIIFNLLGNAFKYTLEGTITVKVVFESTKASVHVIDTGCGIADHELGLIFDRFHRVETTSRSTGGTGIGLALTLELVKTLGGSLAVESAVGQGSTFSAIFPRGFTHLPPSQVVHEGADVVALPPRAQNSLSIVEEAASWKLLPPGSPINIPGSSASATTALTTPSRNSRGSISETDDPFLLSAELLDLRDSTILLADDNADLRQYIGGLLGKAFRVVQVEDGQEALEYCRRSPPSLVVSDVMMPRLDGTGLLHALRADPATALIPVIFLSAQAGPEARVEALLSGADDYLVKPFQGKELLARVNIHLQLGKMRLELERRVEERTRALIESEMRYRGLADRYSTLSLLSPVGIFMADAFGSVNYANPRFFDISGIAPDGDVAGWRNMVMDEYRETVNRTWLEATTISPKNRKAIVTTMEFRWKGKENWVLFEIRPFAENGIQRGFVGSITDISAQKRVERLHIEEVERRAADSEEMRRQTEQYLDMSSHELRNPLSGVWQNAQVVGDSFERFIEVLEDLQDGEVPDEETVDSLLSEMHENVEAVESIILCATHQQRIADDILNVSKLSMNLLQISVAPFDLVSKVQEVVAIFAVECAQKAIKLSLKADKSVTDLNAGYIEADAGRLNQCLINFVTNGVKYTAESKRRVINVHVHAFSSPPPQSENAMRVIGRSSAVEASPDLSNDIVWIRYGVEDSGKGLSKAELEKLFARFSQANPKSDQYGGSGLGLYVSKKLVELHHGFIEVESTPGHGSTFRFAIPARRALQLTNGDKTTAPSGALTPSGRKSKSRTGSATSGQRSYPTLTGATVPKRESRPCHVLVVEDNQINQKVLNRQLKIAGHSVTIANNGREGLDFLLAEGKESKSAPIEIVLMDIEMPVMGGLEAIKLLREMERSGEISKRYPVIAVTGNARQSQQADCLAAGFDTTVTKPYNISVLLATIDEYTDRS